MSPIIDMQRRLVEVGRIRMGTKQGKRPVRLEHWRLTSRDQARLEAAAQLFGGKVAPWAERAGEFELITETSELPIMLLPGQTISQHYELWSGGGCKRRCDGETEQLTDGPCLCNPEKRECKPHTRLGVLLPDVPGLGTWRLDTTGYYAAVELVATVDFLEQATARGALLPARLRIDQRVQVKDGQTKKFPVPVVDVDIRMLDTLALEPAALDQPGRLELPAGYTPLVAHAGVTLAEGLDAVAGETTTRRHARSAAPIGDDSDAEFDSSPLPVVDGQVVETDPPSAPQLKKLNVLVGKLRDAGHLATEDVYIAAGREPIASDDGIVHWSPLRDSLSKDDASRLIEALVDFEASLGESAALNPAAGSPNVAELTKKLLELADKAGNRADVEKAIARHAGDVVWLQRLIGRAEEKLAEKKAEAAA